LLNDHLFRVYWPGWWTGKLGDFAWLFFFPFALAVIFSWIVPRKWRHSELWTALLAFTVTGGVFALAKTWAPFHAWLTGAAGGLFGWPVNWRLDPSDLMALLSLAGAAWLWRSIPEKPARQPKPIWLLVGMAGILTLANSPMPEAGVTCLEVIDGRLYAFASYSAYRAESGGMVWEDASHELSPMMWNRDDCNPFTAASIEAVRQIQDPRDPSVIYRLTRGKAIERSQDGGQTWQIDFQLEPEAEAMRTYYRLRNHGNVEYFSGPSDAAFEPASNHLVLAMGHSGVLVRQEDGHYSYAAVGIHSHEEPAVSRVWMILFPGEVLLAVILGGLSVVYLWLRSRRFSFRHVIGGISGLGWMFASLLPPALSDGYGQALVMLVLLASGILLLPLVIEVFIRAGIASSKLLLRCALLLLVSAVLFFLPFIAWSLNILPNYRLAQVTALALAGGWVYWQHRKEGPIKL